MLQQKLRPATYADIEALPPNLVGEILFGVLHTHLRPTPKHGVSAGELGYELTGPFRRGRGGPGGWFFIPEPELHLGPHVAEPPFEVQTFPLDVLWAPEMAAPQNPS